MRRLVSSLLVLTIAACGDDITAPMSAHGVSITVTQSGIDAYGTTMSVRIANGASSTAFLIPCGAGPLLLVQQLVNGRWQSQPIALLCPAPLMPGPLTIAAGDALVVTRSFSLPGRFRLAVDVGTSSDMNDGEDATSNSFDIR